MAAPRKPKVVKLTCPPSETHLGVNFLGFFSCLAMLAAIRAFAPEMDILTISILAMLATITPVLLVEVLVFKVYRRPTAGLKPDNAITPANPERVAIKLVGLIATFAFLGFLYWLLPEYKKPLYERYWTLLSYGIPLLMLLAIPYFWLMDSRMKAPDDAYLEMGHLALFRWKGLDIGLIGRHLRNWLVKGFFLPLMFVYLGGNAQTIVTYDFSKMNSFIDFYDYMYNFLFFGDLIYAAVGYAMTFRIFDTHIRSSEPTFRGWMVALVCYAPFWQGVFYANYFAYDDNFFWGHWLADYAGLKIMWGCLIMLLIVVYSTATICLGYRFSNLTYRGLVTNGPYRFTKHPAYVSKNLSWWLISVPFISHEGVLAAISHSCLLLGVNLIYYLRARTEEAHLSHYPEYVQYGLYMNEHSLFAPLTKFLPFLKYQAPAHLPLKAVADKV